MQICSSVKDKPKIQIKLKDSNVVVKEGFQFVSHTLYANLFIFFSILTERKVPATVKSCFIYMSTFCDVAAILYSLSTFYKKNIITLSFKRYWIPLLINECKVFISL